MATKNKKQGLRPRPLSPHISIYRPQITSMLSIAHRLTGIFLVGGLLLFAAVVVSLGFDLKCFNCAYGFLTSIYGTIILVGFSLAMYYHLLNGVRHLFWDAGYGYSLPVLKSSGIFVVILTLVLTALTWGAVYVL